MTAHDPSAAGKNGESRSTSGLVSDLLRNVSALVRQEIDLARAETSEKISQSTRGASSLAIGGAIAYLGAIFLVLAVTLALANVLAPWLSALIVGGVILIVGLVMLKSGQSKLKAQNLAPNRTIRTVRDDAEFARRQAKGG